MTGDGVEPIAVIGLACRFPGASDVERFWSNLAGGRESISIFDRDELRAAGVPEEELDNPDYVPAAPVMAAADRFDADLFGLTEGEASRTDPQIRAFLEVCHAALEEAGYDPFAMPDSVGVFGCTEHNGYLEYATRVRPDLMSDPTGVAVAALNHATYLSTTVAHRLDLRGPAITVLTACSSSLVAVHLAAQALRAGECEAALAGGAVVDVPLGHGYRWTPGSVLAVDGHCRPFDAAASGTLFGSGAGVVLLKRLDQAIADGDRIRAVVRGSAVNNDGAEKASFSAPSVVGQAAAVAEAMALAAARPSDMDYVEAHATGTALGDPVEVAALAEAYTSLAAEPLAPGTVAIGSVKSNIGHLAAVAGVAGLIKTVLMLDREAIAPTINVSTPNPRLELEKTPFRVATSLRPWPRRPDRPRLAGVSSLGIGGTNAHVVVAEAPTTPVSPPPAPDRPSVLLWSARTEAAETELRERLSAYLAGPGQRSFADAAGTLRYGRTAHPVRAALVCGSALEAAEALAGRLGVIHSGRARGDARVALLFAGDDAYRPRVAAGLYGTVRAFSVVMDEWIELAERAGPPLHDIWLSDREVDEPQVVQPLLFGVAYALARTWEAAGVRPVAVLGHGLGELVAGAVAGVFGLPDALRLVSARAEAMSPHPGGSAEAVERLVAVVGEIGPRRPSVPVYSGRTGARLTDAEVTDPRSWGGRLARAVRSGAAPASLLAGAERPLLVMAGPPAREPAIDGTGVLATVSGDGRDDHCALLDVAARLWTLGIPIEWSGVDQPAPVRRVGVPGYPYQRKRYWADPFPDRDPTANQDRPAGHRDPADLASAPARDLPEPPPDSPFGVVEWIPAAPRADAVATEGDAALVLLPEDRHRARTALRALRHAGLRAVPVRPGGRRAESDGGFQVAGPADLDWVLDTLAERGTVPGTLVHAATLDSFPEPDAATTDAQLDAAFGSLLALARQALRQPPGHPPPRLVVLTAESVDVTGGEPVAPAKATVHGLVRTLWAEEPRMPAGVVDVGARVPDALLARELAGADGIVALRGTRRWAPVERPLTVPRSPRPVLRERGVYLVTGGFGGLGLAVARGLAGTGLHPRLVLLGRRERGADGGPAAAAVTDLRAQGAEVMCIAADVTQLEAVRAAVTTVRRRFGPIDGVLHLAGLAGGRMLAFRAPEDAAAVLAPKARGAVHLAEALRDEPPGFTVYFSSRAGTDGMVGGGDYAAANAFLDAMATAGLGAERTLSVAWPLWQGPGMAGAAGAPPASVTDGQEVVWEVDLGAATEWTLDEHRVLRKPLLPAAAHLDLLVGWYVDRVTGDGRPVELTDVVFRVPFSDHGTRRLRARLRPAGDGHAFTLCSRSVREPDGPWVEHATGAIRPAEPASDRLDVDGLRERLALAGGPSPRQREAGGALLVGPRWDNLVEAWAAGEEELLRLALPAAYTGDVRRHRLHPALLDRATGAVRGAMPASHVPFLYSRLTVYGRLPAELLAYVVRRPAGPDTAVGDVTLAAPDGRVLARVEGFTMRRIELVEGWDAAASGASAGSGSGLAPERGVRLLLDLLGGDTPPVVLVRPHEDDHPVWTGPASSRPVPDAGAVRRGAPSSVRAGAAGKPTVGEEVSALWQEVLGSAPADDDTDFFDAGGDSLAAVDLVARIRAAFGVELSVGLLLDTRTFGGLRALVDGARGG